MKLAQSNSKTLVLWLIGMMAQVSLCTRSFADGDEPNSSQGRPNVSAVGTAAASGSEWERLSDLYFALVLPPEPDDFKQPSAIAEQRTQPPVQNVSASDQFANRRRTSEAPLASQWTPAETERPGLVHRHIAVTNLLRDDPPPPPGVVDSVKIDDESEAPAPVPRPLAAAVETLAPVVVNQLVPMQPTELFRRNGYLADSTDVGGAGWPCAMCGQSGCSCESGARWVFGADAVFLTRSEANGFSDSLISSGSFSTRSEDLTFDYTGGPRFRVVRDQDAGFDIEAIYYEIDEWSDDSFLNGPVFALGVDIGNGSAAARYSSEFQNFEANLYHDWSNWTKLLVGFRWLRLDEFASVTASGTNVANFDRRVDTTNNLYGGQIGLQHSFWDRGGRLIVDGSIKAGIYGNSIDRTSVGFGAASLGDDATSFVGELDLALNYELTAHWSATVGYQGIWITDVAQAVDQFFSPTQVFHDETVVLNGVRVGAACSW